MKNLTLSLLFAFTTLAATAQWGTVTGATTNYRSTFTGNLGIGTGTSTVPADKLEVVGNVRSNQFNAINGFFNVSSSSNLSLQTNATTRLTILNANGRVGIGNTSPAQALDVTGSILASTNIMSTAGVFNVNGSNNLSLQTNGTTRLTILNANGRVGINTTSPTEALDVNGSVKATSFMVGSTPLVSSQWVTSASNINYTTGAVSIGTTTAPSGYKLAVGGKTVTEEVVVKLQGNWPDYVFEPDYNLMPLSELERYIKQNKHLPDVPEAKEVADKGIALGELNATLLKKVEELTLYLIELKKENETQQRQIETLLKKK